MGGGLFISGCGWGDRGGCYLIVFFLIVLLPFGVSRPVIIS